MTIQDQADAILQGVQNPDELLVRLAQDRDALLKACNETLDYWTLTGFAECDPGCDCIVETVRAAIAQAERP